MTTNYVSIKSVLYDLSLSLNERYWNEAAMTEWLVHGLRQINLEPILETKTKLLTVTKHKAVLPSDFKYLIQAAKYTYNNTVDALADEDLPELSTWVAVNTTPTGWVAMRLSSQPYHSSVCLDTSITKCTSCEYEYSVSPSGIITTNFLEGTIMIAYLAWAKNEDNEILIPDDETLKEALRQYVLFRYWEMKDLMMEQGAERRMKDYLQRWQILKLKAMNVNLPDVNRLENLKNIWNRLVPRENRFDQLFLTLGNKENVDF